MRPKPDAGGDNCTQDERKPPLLVTPSMRIGPLHCFSHKKYAALGNLARSRLPRNSPLEPCDSAGYAAGFFFDWHEFVAELLGLPFEFRGEAFFAFGVALCPKLVVVFPLL